MGNCVGPKGFKNNGYIILFMDKEIWKVIENYEGIYEVSSFGKVKNTKTGNILKQMKTNKGVYYVKLCVDGLAAKTQIHSIVGNAFLKKTPNRNIIRHIDGNKANNNVKNLEYATTYVKKKGDIKDENLEWKKVVGYEDLYEVSNTGIIRSIASNINLKPMKNSEGFHYVKLCKNNNISKVKIHRIVGDAFLKQKNIPKFVIKHISEDITDNNVNNLELIGRDPKDKKQFMVKKTNESIQIIEIEKRKKSQNEINRHNKKIQNRKSIIDSDNTSIWKDVMGYEGSYKISNKGEIYSCKSNKILKKTKRGMYYTIGLAKAGKNKIFFVHRLVAFAFIPQINNKNFVNHKDKNGGNNNVENLEWVNSSENLYRQ